MRSLLSHRPRSTKLAATLAVTAATILGASVLIILWVLGVSSSAMDRAQNAGETRLVGVADDGSISFALHERSLVHA